MHEIYGSRKFKQRRSKVKDSLDCERINPRNILVIELHFRWMLFESIELDILFSLHGSFFERKCISITKPFLAKASRSIVSFVAWTNPCHKDAKQHEEQRSVYVCICMKEKINRKKEMKDFSFFFFFQARRIEKLRRVVDRKSIGYGLVGRSVGVLWAIDSCDVYTRLENLLPLHELRAARPEARRVTEWRVDLRTPTRVRFLASFAPQAPHHWCTPARHSIALGSLHTLSRRAARTRLYAHHAYSLLRKDCPPSAFFPLSLQSRGISCLPSCTIFFLGTRQRQRRDKLQNEGDRTSAGWTMRKPDWCKGKLINLIN